MSFNSAPSRRPKTHAWPINSAGLSTPDRPARRHSSSASPAWLEMASAVRRKYGFPIVYDCHDWLPGFGDIAPALLAQESALFRLADLVVFSAQVLQDRVLDRQAIGHKSVLIRNAVEPFDAPAQIPSMPAGRAPTIGYVGSLDHWFDVDAVAAVAREHPQWRIVLAGRVEDRRVLRLQECANVVIAGEIPYSAVAAQLTGVGRRHDPLPD